MRADGRRQPRFALALVLVAVLIVSTACGGDSDAEETPATSEEVVREFTGAVNDGDNERAAALLADGAIIYGEPVAAGAGEEAVAALACTVEIESIETTGDTVTAELRATGSRESAEENCEPAGDDSLTARYTIRDGKIAEIND